MKAFHGKPEIKEKYLARVYAHYKADEIIKGEYWQNGKGCAVGCTIHSSDHNRYEKELGIPMTLAHLEDTIFENLTPEEAKSFPWEFLSAIPVGVDLRKVVWKFMYYCVSSCRNNAFEEGKKAIDKLLGLIEREIHGDSPTPSQLSAAWSAAESAARSATWSAAESAARSAARSAAESAAWSAAWSATWSAARSAAESATWPAAESAARSAARSAAFSEMKDVLLQLFIECQEDNQNGDEKNGR